MNKFVVIGSISLMSGSVLAAAAPSLYVAPTKKIYARVDLSENFFITPAASTSSAVNNTSISASSENVSYTPGYNLGLGYQIVPRFRVDMDFTYRPSIPFKLIDDAPETGKGHLNNYTFMFNAYYDFKSKIPIVPYLMAGIGVSHNSTSKIYWLTFNQYENGQTSTYFAWQLGLGLTYPIRPNLLVDFNYQLVDLGTFRNTGTYNVGTPSAPTTWNTLFSNQLQLGLRYYFL